MQTLSMSAHHKITEKAENTESFRARGHSLEYQGPDSLCRSRVLHYILIHFLS